MQIEYIFMNPFCFAKTVAGLLFGVPGPALRADSLCAKSDHAPGTRAQTGFTPKKCAMHTVSGCGKRRPLHAVATPRLRAPCAQKQFPIILCVGRAPQTGVPGGRFGMRSLRRSVMFHCYVSPWRKDPGYFPVFCPLTIWRECAPFVTCIRKPSPPGNHTSASK